MPDFVRVIMEHGIQRAEDLYPAVGFGKIAPGQILGALFPDLAPPAEPQAKRSGIATVVKKVLGRGDTPITVKGQDGLLVYRAKCCNPIRGDEIVGYITRGKGISVHTTTCPNLNSFLGSDRITEVEWIEVPEDELFAVRLAIKIEDRQGILAEITSAISNLKTNIRDSRSATNEGGKGTVDLTVEINDVKHLQKIVKGLKTIRGIEEVTRVARIP
jgi:GTP pyrophosphokinase